MTLDEFKDKIGIGEDKVYGVMGAFDNPDDLVEGGRQIREMGYTKLDAMTPFPVHGIDDAIGVPPSKLGWLVIWFSALGCFTAITLIWYVGAIDYRLVIGGKPFFDFSYTIPIAFELTVLFSAFATFLGMWAINGLPRLYHPSFNYSQAHRASDDLFILVVEADDPKFDAQACVEHLRSVGAGDVEVVEGWVLRPGFVVPVLLALAGCSSVQRDTPLQVWDDMKHQQKFKAQAPVVGIFADGRSNRLLPEDTVSRDGYRDDSPYNTGLENGMYVGKNPVAVTPALLEQGQAKFNIYCSPCHDQTGMGRGIIPAHVPIWQPSNLTEDRVVQFADGDIFNVITNGRRTMPPYRFQVVVADRWAIIAYVRALQRAAHGTPAEAPAGTVIAALK